MIGFNMRKWLLTTALAWAAISAHAATTPTTMSVKDGTGASQILRSDQNSDGSLATHNVPEVAGAAVSTSNPMPVVVQNPPSTQAVSAQSLPLPAGAAVEGGGNLAAIAANTAALSTLASVVSNTNPISTAPTVSGITSLSASSSSTMFAAGTRNAYRVTNLNPSGGSDAVCTDDGSTPSASNWSFRVYQATFNLEARPGPVSNQAIQCIGLTGTVAIKAEQY